MNEKWNKKINIPLFWGIIIISVLLSAFLLFQIDRYYSDKIFREKAIQAYSVQHTKNTAEDNN